MNVVVDGLMTNYQKIGVGKKAIVMLHGWGDSSQTFSRLAAEISQDYSVYAVDLPGFGGTQKPGDVWGLKDYADFVANWLRKIDIKNPYCIVGHSFGGAVSIIGTATGVLAPEKLILLASAGVRNKKPFRKRAYHIAAKAGRIPLFLLPPDKAQQIKLKLYNRIGSDVLLVPDMRKTFVKTVSEDVQEQAAKIKIPALLIYGDRDRETPPNDGLLLSRAIAGSEIKTMNAGHFVHQELTAEVAEAARRFLAEKKR